MANLAPTERPMAGAAPLSPFRGKRSGPARYQDGLSLIEVALALGIVAFSMISLLGILPIGLGAAREAAAQTTRTHILQQISADLAVVAFGPSLDSYLSQAQFFDDGGKRLASSSNAIYAVTLNTQAPIYPGAEELDGLNERLGRVVVNIHRVGESEANGFIAFLPSFNSSGAFVQ